VVADYPKELQKKITLLFHFKNYLENQENINPIDNGANVNLNKDASNKNGDKSVG